MAQKVVVGLSGGVDSSVAAWLLKEQGYEVTGMFMKNWHDTTGLIGECPEDEDKLMAELVAHNLDIPFLYVDLSEQYRKRVVEYMFAEYEQGRTPNPDVLCNREIKFDIFMKTALGTGADCVATGHYCRKERIEKKGETLFRLMAGADDNKDQSYFLCQLSQEQLQKALFPIGELTKPEVRKIAAEQKLSSADRKDSQGICFVGKVRLPEFLMQKLKARKGRIVEIDANNTIYNAFSSNIDSLSVEEKAQDYVYSPEDGTRAGIHNGAHFYTIGQRKGLNVGGKAKPLYVIGTDVINNIVYVGQGQDHPGLFRPGLFIDKNDLHYIRPDLKLAPGDTKEYLVRIRYRQALQEATLHMKDKGLFIVFKEQQRGITSGQFAAWYDGEELIGSGVIT